MNNKPHWSVNYVGIPYTDYDCAELCVKVQLEIFKRVISLPTERSDSVRELSITIRDVHEDYAYKTKNPIEGDAVLMIGYGRINHIGVVCNIKGQEYILHAMRNANQTVLTRIDALSSLGLELEGYYKWK